MKIVATNVVPVGLTGMPTAHDNLNLGTLRKMVNVRYLLDHCMPPSPLILAKEVYSSYLTHIFTKSRPYFGTDPPFWTVTTFWDILSLSTLMNTSKFHLKISRIPKILPKIWNFLIE